MPRLTVWASGVACCAALFLMVYLLSVHTSAGQLVDTMMRVTAEGTDHPFPPLHPENRWIPLWVLGPPSLALLGLVLARMRSGASLLVPVVAAAGAAAANVTTQAFKRLWPQRPDLMDVAPEWSTNSLPSGHTTMAASAAVLMFLAAAPRHRPAAGVLGAFWAACWGGWIYAEGWHRPSDMIAAYLVTAAWGLICGWVVLRREIREPHQVPAAPGERLRGRREAGLCAAVGTIGVVAGLVFLLGPAADAGLRGSVSSPSPELWLAGAAFSSAPAFLTAAAGLALFARPARVVLSSQQGTSHPSD